MIARRPSTCPRCHGKIIPGQSITNDGDGWHHEDCNAPAPTGIAANQDRPRPKNPGALMTDKQLELIGALLTERVFTQGEATTFIDYLKSRPRKDQAPAANLAERLGA